MALTINTNVAALNAQRNLGKSQGALNQSMERLSSGLRINSAIRTALVFCARTIDPFKTFVVILPTHLCVK